MSWERCRLKMRANQEARKRVKADKSAIRRIMNDWGPIQGSPSYEYDCLIDHIISELYSGHAIASFIRSELNGHFGITEPEVEIARVADSIATYWKRQHK
jgi:hypothetical protein